MLRLLLVVRKILLVCIGRIRRLLFGKIPSVLDVLELPILRQTVHEIDLVGTIGVLHHRLVSPVQRATDHDPRSVYGYLGVGMRLGQPILHVQARNIRFGGTFVLEGDSALVERAPQRLVAGRRGRFLRISVVRILRAAHRAVVLPRLLIAVAHRVALSVRGARLGRVLGMFHHVEVQFPAIGGGVLRLGVASIRQIRRGDLAVGRGHGIEEHLVLRLFHVGRFWVEEDVGGIAVGGCA